ncbi:MAG: sigma-70 family RNA polymerase sigma factor [Blastocatellia bacterium]|nr:sigma-70 family RNA polymerase sigma factor [Blastocatellia bacterium]
MWRSKEKQSEVERRKLFEQEAVCHLETLLRTAARLVTPSTEAEDIVQETYLRAWKHFGTFETGTNCRAWLFRIMFNVIKSRASRKSQMLTDQLVEKMEEGARSSSNVISFDPLKTIEGHEMLKAVRLLKEDYRAVLWLIVVDEFSYQEAAGILNIPVGTVMSRLHRARNGLRKLFQTSAHARRAEL